MEIWKTVQGIRGYEVSSFGRVRSFVGRGPTPSLVKVPTVLKPFRHTGGYLQINLGLKHRRFVHRLVLEAFVGPCPEGMEACHNNGDCDDNRAENLRWDKHSANLADKRVHGTHPFGEAHGRRKLTEAEARQIRAHRGWLTNRHLAEVFGLTKNHVAAIHHGRAWGHLMPSSSDAVSPTKTTHLDRLA